MTNQASDEYWRNKLQLTLNGSLEHLESIESELSITRALRANGGDDDEHDPDGIPLSSVLQLLEGQKMRAVDQIREVATALSDLANGQYGICKKCSQRITSARLEVRPTTRTCMKCAG
ncbi:MAG: molecular chaperone DnaK [Actinomycetota bacterium]|nr:molecular chaperone DnaK [Actinomycetota bacterium]